jgi:23S rRNA pseudouridine2605 synthase
LQKVLAHAGIGSRRSCEEMILQGRVSVDGKVVRELGTRVDPRASQIAVDGQPIRLERHVYFAVSKPKGYVSTNDDPAGRPRVIDLLPEIPQRVYTVGRLDEMSVGLMILTNDGELANRLAHPKFGVEKIYRAVVAGNPSREVLDKLTDGMWIAEGKVRAKRVRVIGHRGESTVLEMVLAEGKNREVRRMLAKLGHKVMSLTRVAVGPIMLKGLAPGEYRPLSGKEIDLLRRVAAGLSVPMIRSPRRSVDRKPARGPTGGRPTQPSTTRPGGRAVPGGAGRPAAPTGPRSRSSAHPPAGPGRRPLGAPPSQRRPAPAGEHLETEASSRRVIGMTPEPGGGTPPRRPRPRPVPPRRRESGGPPRLSVVPRPPAPTMRKRPRPGRGSTGPDVRGDD